MIKNDIDLRFPYRLSTYNLVDQKMKKLCMLAVACLIASHSHAGSNSLVVATSKTSSSVAIGIEVPADHVVVPLTISSDEKDPLRNLDSIQAARSKLVAAAGKTGSIQVVYGVQSLSVSAREDGKFLSYSSSSASSTSDVYLTAPLGKDRNVFQAVRELASFLQGFPVPDKIRFRLGVTSLGLDDPEQYRDRLLALIAREIERTRAAFGNVKSFEAGGLESVVLVTQKDEKNVTVFLPVQLRVWGE